MAQNPDHHRARTLRQNQTEAERKLWFALRDRRLAGHKFTRQLPIGSYVADFGCRAQKLVIEIDGGQHADNSDDVKRSHEIQKASYHVIRFWNNEVLQNLDGVLEVILLTLKELER